MIVTDILRRSAAQYADLPALIDAAHRYTHAQLWEPVDRLSHALHALGLRKGHVLLAWLPNTHAAVEAELACLQSGVIWVTLNRSLTWPEVRGVVEATQPRVMIADPQFMAGASATPAPSMQLILADATADSAFQGDDYEALLAAHEPRPPDVRLHEDDVTRLRYTSGTTGTSKAAMLTHRVYLASLEVQQRALHPLGPDDRALHAAPLTHASAALLYPTLAAGGANVLLPGFDAETVVRMIESERISAMFCVPTMLYRLAAAPILEGANLTSLRTITYGGAPIAPEKLTALMDRLPNVLVQIYGLTEAVHPVTVLRREEHWPGNPRLLSIGTATHINEVEIQDDAGRPMPDGEVGELCVRGRNVMAGYWNDDSATAQVFRDGWLLTGDVAYRDSDGDFYIVD
ncbi:MAG: AMP-binding protein, partial [Candidatus Hydrogenedentales bacterium]